MNFESRSAAIPFLGLAVAFLSLSATAQFDPLFQLGRVKGECLVRRAGSDDFEVAVESRAYPFGTEVRTRADSQVVLHLSSTVQLRLGSGSAVAIMQESDGGLRASLITGLLGIFSPMEEAELPLVVRTPVADADNLKGRIELHLTDDGELHTLDISSNIAELRVKGPQFTVERMGRNTGLEIQTAFDESYTGLTGTRGEYEVFVERGSEEPSIANFRSNSRVKIWRRRAALSDRLAVSVMIASGSGGAIKESFAYLQGESAIQGAVFSKGAGEEEAPESATNEVAADPGVFDGFPEAPVAVPEIGAGEGAAVDSRNTEAETAAPQNDLWNF